MADYKTPGVYIREENAFTNSVVEVETAVPAFIGFTETAKDGKKSLRNTPTRLTSMVEFEQYFGGSYRTQVTYGAESAAPTSPPTGDASGENQVGPPTTDFLLHRAMQLFFANGGGPCYVVSVGSYGDMMEASAFTDGIDTLVKEQEPTMIVVPDAVLLDSAGWKSVYEKALMHCGEQQSRITILDVPYADDARPSEIRKVVGAFRDTITSDFFNYGAAYYPWVNTSVVEASDVDFRNLDADGRAALQADVKADLSGVDEGDALAAKIAASDLSEKDATQAHQTLLQVSPTYKHVMGDVRKQLNLLPPAAGMAGVYTRIDNTQGVFQAPANTGMNLVVSPAVNVSHVEQEDMNVPLSGKAVNAIRTFPGRGVLIWGARTLDGNSQDWRYINVRRTLIMLEQSIKNAAQAYVFAPNKASTWVSVRNMISNYLTNKWKEGALVGATADEAFLVDVGLGSTMTPNDILDGFMRVTVKVAVVRPAEFIVITFQQKMQTS